MAKANRVYVIDTCSLTALPRAYPKDIFRPVWDKIEDMLGNGALITCEDVYLELEAQDDELLQWAKEQKEKGIFLRLTSEVQIQAKEVLRTHRNLLDLKKRKSSADVFIIALALCNNASVVTEEKPSGGPEKSKIPDVCGDYSIPCINLVTMLREAGFKL